MAGPKILDDHVTGADQAFDDRPRLGMLDVERYAFLVAAMYRPPNGTAVLLLAPLADRIADAWRLDLDHLRAEIGKHARREGCGNIMAEFKHANTTERQILRLHGVDRRVTKCHFPRSCPSAFSLGI